MATIRVRAKAAIEGLRYGEVGELELTERIEALIEAGRLDPVLRPEPERARPVPTPRKSARRP